MSDTRAEVIDTTIDDAVSNLLYYDRKEDEELPRGAIEDAVALGETSIQRMVETFETSLRKGERARGSR